MCCFPLIVLQLPAVVSAGAAVAGCGFSLFSKQQLFSLAWNSPVSCQVHELPSTRSVLRLGTLQPPISRRVSSLCFVLNLFLCSVTWWSSVLVLEKMVKNCFLPNLYFSCMDLQSLIASSLNHLFSGQRCLTCSVMPLCCTLWFLWEEQHCTHVSRCGKTMCLCKGIMTLSVLFSVPFSGISGTWFAFLMAAECQGNIFMDLPLISQGYHCRVALVSSESLILYVEVELCLLCVHCFRCI